MNDTTRHFHGRFLALAERDNWEFATRVNASGVAVLVPVTPEGCLVLVEQYRIPVEGRVVELPAGLVGDGADPKEGLLAAAQRELEEETGFRAGLLRPLLDCPSTAGLSDEIVTFILAEELEKVGPGGGDDSESIEIHLVDLESADSWLRERQSAGVYLDPKLFTALYWLEHREWLGTS